MFRTRKSPRQDPKQADATTLSSVTSLERRREAPVERRRKYRSDRYQALRSQIKRPDKSTGRCTQDTDHKSKDTGTCVAMSDDDAKMAASTKARMVSKCAE